MKRLYKILACLAAVVMLSACTVPEGPGDPGQPTTESTQGYDENLRCLEISRFSGKFVEDGSDRKVTEVAAILVGNDTGKFVNLATITYSVGDRTATFKVTGLASGEKAWVLEQDAMQIKPEDELVFEDCVVSYHPDPVIITDDLAVSRSGHNLTLTNQTDETLVNVAVYYKNRMDDGMFMGGITYQMIFGDLEPGQSVTLSKDHFMDSSDIVRFSYQTK